MQIVTARHVWLITTSVTAMACAIVAAVIILFYPQPQWRFELTLWLGTTIAIWVPVTYFMALKMRENAVLNEELQHLLNHDQLTDIQVTMSIGGAVKQADKSIDVAIREADAALYRAKNNGRDQTVFMSAPDQEVA